MEEWRTLQYNGETFEQYEISNLGNLRNTKTKKLIKQSSGRDYLAYCTNLGKRPNGKTHYKIFRIHRGVGCTFLPTDDYKLQLNHKNGIKTDNRVENLEWCTAKENIQHAVKMGLFKRSKNGQNQKRDIV